jgi:hypothetical protein
MGVEIESIKKQEIEPLSRQWKTFNIFSDDPLSAWAFDQDYQLAETSSTYDEYWRLAQQQNPKKLTSLLIESWKWRADSRSNVVMSTEGCLKFDTLIWAKNGKRKLNQFKKFVFVKTHNFETGKDEYKRAKIIHSGRKQLYEITVEDNTKIYATKDHTFFLSNKKEKKLSELKIGGNLFRNSIQNYSVKIKSIKKIGFDETIDLQVPDNHNFYLGNGVLTHNSQGSGKSLSNIEFGRILGKIFDRPFSLQDIAFYPEEMEDLISHSQNRQTMMCDEQQITSVGLMSNTIRNRLVDFEEQLRFSMCNLLYIAPSLHQHQHYYTLESFKPVRFKNKVCNVCKKLNCLNCEISEEKRSGYPAYFVLMLKTHRANDGMLVPRGYVLAKMPPLKIVREYELIKQEHIRRLKAKESMRWDFLKKLAEEIWQRGQNEILRQTKSGKYIIAPQKVIKMIFYSAKGMNYLPLQTEELLLTMIAEKAREHIITEGLNEDIEKEENKKAGEENAI